MKIKYSGNKAVEFIKELESFDINNVHIEIYDDSVYSSLHETFLYIKVFVVDTPKSGIGTQAMNYICETADKYHINLFLFPYGKTYSFYKKFNFEYKEGFEYTKIFRFYKDYDFVTKKSKGTRYRLLEKIKNYFLY